MSESITVGICAHNEEETIGKLIDQIFDEDIPLKEIIVVVAGEDHTLEILNNKKRENRRLKIIKEEKREGQTKAQNKILSKAAGDSILFLDADGYIRPKSLENLYKEFNGDNIVSGREIPITESSFIGKTIEIYGDIHHSLCLQEPRFSTMIGIISSDLVQSFPSIILDDGYIEHLAKKSDLDLIYAETAVKYHKTPNNWSFFFYQQKKNWLGRFELKEKGFEHSKSEKILLTAFLNNMKEFPVKHYPHLFALGAIEASSYISAQYDRFKGRYSRTYGRK